MESIHQIKHLLHSTWLEGLRMNHTDNAGGNSYSGNIT